MLQRERGHRSPLDILQVPYLIALFVIHTDHMNNETLSPLTLPTIVSALTFPTIVTHEQPNDHGCLKSGASLAELCVASTNWDAELNEMVLTGEDLKFLPDGLLHGGQRFRMDVACYRRLLDRLGAPVSYLERLGLDFQREALSRHVERNDFGSRPTALLRGNDLITIGRGDLTNLSCGAVVGTISEELGKDGHDLFVASIHHDAELLDVELVSPSQAITVRTGDIVQAGLSITHNRYGDQATRIQAFVYRLVCQNGMTRRECVSRDNIVRTRRLPISYPNARETQLNQIRRLTRQNWDSLEAQLGELRKTSERPTDVQKLLTRWLQRARISERAIMPRLLSAWAKEGSENSQYGAVNALTRVATHDNGLSQRQRRILASLAGLLAFSEVHGVCPRCFSVLHGDVAEARIAA